MQSLIIDDEAGNRNLLEKMLNKHCPWVSVLGNASSVDEAYNKINEFKPDLLFLDIKMQGKNGFDLLRMYNVLDFSVIFVTGFDEYAVKAFEFNAIDYLLKPIDYNKLVSAVKKAEQKTSSAVRNEVIHFVHSLEEKTNVCKRITLHGSDKVKLVDLKDIVCLSALRGYSEVYTSEKQKFVSARSLSEYEDILLPVKQFVRVSKSYIINTDYIDSYSKGTDCIIYMKKFDMEIEVSRRRKTEVLALIR